MHFSYLYLYVGAGCEREEDADSGGAIMNFMHREYSCLSQASVFTRNWHHPPGFFFPVDLLRLSWRNEPRTRPDQAGHFPTWGKLGTWDCVARTEMIVNGFRTPVVGVLKKRGMFVDRGRDTYILVTLRGRDGDDWVLALLFLAILRCVIESWRIAWRLPDLGGALLFRLHGS